MLIKLFCLCLLVGNLVRILPCPADLMVRVIFLIIVFWSNLGFLFESRRNWLILCGLWRQTRVFGILAHLPCMNYYLFRQRLWACVRIREESRRIYCWCNLSSREDLCSSTFKKELQIFFWFFWLESCFIFWWVWCYEVLVLLLLLSFSLYLLFTAWVLPSHSEFILTYLFTPLFFLLFLILFLLSVLLTRNSWDTSDVKKS